MSHPFEVGKPYRNRSGEYVVEAIEGNRMIIRYTDGRTLTTSVDIQARIWENIQFEKQIAMAEERKRQAMEARREARQRTARTRKKRTKPTYEGFEESDFEEKPRGVAWSGRKELGRVLAYELEQRGHGSFGMWIVPRQSEVHVAREEHYNKDTRETNPALFVAVSEDGVSYGFHVGKPSGKVKAEWPWSALLKRFAKEEQLQKALHLALQEHGLALDVLAMEVSYGQVGHITAEDDEFLWQHEDAGQEVSRQMNGEALAEYLERVAPTKRCDLYVRRLISPKVAQQGGAAIASQILAAFEVLLPQYEASTGN
jgi:hypothetical protein